MQPFTTLDAIAAPFDAANVDTDQIIPARFLKQPRGPGYQRWLFHDLRFAADGTPDPGFVLHHAPFDRAEILVASRNFGVGSSREAAVYALAAFGIRCVIAASFGDIFFSNALKNGLLPVQLAEDTVASLRAAMTAAPGTRLVVDLAAQRVTTPGGQQHHFVTPPFARHCLLQGLDELGLTLTLLPEIEAFEARHPAIQ